MHKDSDRNTAKEWAMIEEMQNETKRLHPLTEGDNQVSLERELWC